jgi:hypothetical protein
VTWGGYASRLGPTADDDANAGVAADLAAPVMGDVAYVIAGIVIAGMLPLLIANAARAIRMELRELKNDPS